uniref:Methyltransferase domain-containing protein n=1 Tax=Chaetoceros debilis TaxID=122233 RepID=A0A7S3PWQ6_9STRA
MGRDERVDDLYVNDCDRIFGKLSVLPSCKLYPDLMEMCDPIIRQWYDTFAFDKENSQLWKRMRRNIPKELNESAFILNEMMKHFDAIDKDSRPVTIIDMCSGVGYLSMFLSHLLPEEKVSRIIPIDVMFPAHNASKKKDSNEEETQEVLEKPKSGPHLSINHLKSPIHPIGIYPRRANIKKGRELRQITEYLIARAPGPVVILGVHLCKSLSVHTIRLFNTTIQRNKSATLFLKPCCLPGRKDLQRREPPFWEFEHMQKGGFGVKTLYCEEIDQTGDDAKETHSSSKDTAIEMKKNARLLTKSKDRDSQVNKNNGEGESRHDHNHNPDQRLPKSNQKNSLFSKWVELLLDAVHLGDGVTRRIEHCPVQLNHFQNQFIVATN